MKKVVKIIGIVACVLYVAHCFLRPLWYVDLTDAPDAGLVYMYNETNISCSISWDDKQELGQILSGVKFKDSPSCDFDESVSVTFWFPEEGKIMICPACDGCPLMRIGDSDYYIKISGENRARFNEIVKKYGMVFPCI